MTASRPSLLLALLALLAASALGVALSHDLLVMRAEDSRDEAFLRDVFVTDDHLPKPWRRVVLENRERGGPFDASPSDVRELPDGSYEVLSWVERQAPDGSWDRRRCLALWHRERFDVWHLTSIAIDGEAPLRPRVIDGPFDGDCDLWLARMFR